MEKRIHPILLYLLLSNILSSASQTLPIRVDMTLPIRVDMVEYSYMTFNRLSMALSDLNSHTSMSMNSSEGFRAWDEALSITTLKGLALSFCVVHGVWGLGYWKEENEIVKSKLASIIWPGEASASPRGWVVPTNGKKLRVGVPVKAGFTEFVSVTWNPNNSVRVEGYCIDVFDAVMAALPYGVPYESIELTYAVDLGEIDTAAADTIVDFTLQPYTGQRVISICSFFFIVFFIWILEHLINQNLKGFWYQVGMTFWCAFSTVVFAHKERPVRHLSRLLLIIWFLAVLILTQSYAASLASMLTVQKLQPTATDVELLIRNREIYIGYMQGSFVFGLLKGMHFDESRLVEYDSPEKLDELLSDGSIAAAFHETPNVKLFLGKYCSKYTTIGPINKAAGFGIVFVIGSDLVTDVSCEVLDMTEGQKMAEIERKWLGDVMNKCLEYSNINNLGPASFWLSGLFLIVGMTAFIIYAVRCE
ncbi:glutamate receptor 2.7-like [Salvia miltiorrhiza]|uniref:glutamate receptor 2.7-like n=1 Tax=Salvia miltiorrhiza TaxID=226208 RepID=UPI0025AC0AA3|nr:glutamate receptor 2.7-like [Salvia miltiorrhiza]